MGGEGRGGEIKKITEKVYDVWHPCGPLGTEYYASAQGPGAGDVPQTSFQHH